MSSVSTHLETRSAHASCSSCLKDDQSSTPLMTPGRATNRHFGVRPFTQFGVWGETVDIAYSAVTFRLVNWVAQHRHVHRDYDELWDACKLANEACFQSLQTVKLSRPSWFLPADEVVFQVIKDPTVIPDNPPKGVLLRHTEALDVFAEHADFYFLRPTFESDTMRVFTGSAAREHAEEDKSDILFMAKLYGPMLRGVATAGRVVEAGLQFTKAAVIAGGRGLLAMERRISDHVERRRIRREANGIVSGIHPETLHALTLRALELDLYREADIFRDALRSWGRADARRLSPIARELGLGGVAARASSESSFVQTARGRGSTSSVAELRAVYQEIQELRRWDPITCFELHRQPGKLWLEAHWFEGADGKTYVHY